LPPAAAYSEGSVTCHTAFPTGKSLITTAQIIQFFVGILCTVPMFVMRGECQTDMQVIASRHLHVAVAPPPLVANAHACAIDFVPFRWTHEQGWGGMQLLALGAVHLYVLPLIGLFANFYIKSYTSAGSSKGKEKKNM
jgi:hypothetical protein